MNDSCEEMFRTLEKLGQQDQWRETDATVSRRWFRDLHAYVASLRREIEELRQRLGE